MLNPSCKYPDISSWDAGLLPHCVLPVGVLEYPVYTLGVPTQGTKNYGLAVFYTD
jgi:hypothetical protein